MNKVLSGLDAFIEYATATRKFADVGFYEEVKKVLLQQVEEVKSQAIHIMSQSNEIDRWQEQYTKCFENNNTLESELVLAKSLLDAANCPQCGDKSGAYYDNYGEMCQCQWCYEVNNLSVKDQ